MRHLAGVDINGWHDWAARNWSEDRDELVAVDTADGGIASQIIYAGEMTSPEAIGGPQAAIAPHGRGNGWGAIGGADRRNTIRELFALSSGDVDRAAATSLSAAVNALSLDARRIVFSITDNAEQMSEARQSAMLSLLRQPKKPLPILLWKPVAAVLAQIAADRLSTEDSGREVDVICHEGGGLLVQTLRLIVPAGLSPLLTPERKGFGRLVAADFGLERLVVALRSLWMTSNPVLLENGVEANTEPEKWLMTDPAGLSVEHVLRKSNGDWAKISRPSSMTLPAWNKKALTHDLVACLQGTGAIFLHTPLRHDLAKDLAGCLSDVTGRVVEIIEKDGIARGCLEAAKRIEKGLPHYLDRLDQVSLVVMEKGEPQFRDLVPKGQTVPANKTYFSEPISNLVWPKGSSEQQFYVRKGDSEIRKWEIKDFSAPQKDQRTVMQLSQTPAQGWAKVEITSQSWLELQQKPIRLDWETMPVEVRSEQEILDELRNPPPVVPLRTVYRYSLDLWNGIDGQLGLSKVLEQFNPTSDTLPSNILKTVLAPFTPFGSTEKFYCVSSDGALPDIPEAREFDQLLQWVAAKLMGHVKRRRALTDNELLRIVSWSFARCPVEVQDEMIEALADSRHPFIQPNGARTVILQGLGRTVTDAVRLKRALETVAKMEPNMNVRACIAFLLSRKKAAPSLLSKSLIEKIVHLTVSAIQDQVKAKKFSTDFNYSLQLVAGLLRYREIEPFALLSRTSDAAKELERTLGKAGLQMQKNPAAYAKKLPIVIDLIATLAGTGGNPNILYMIEND